MDLLALAPGSVFADRYRVLRGLRSGGMGAVYEAEHTATSQRVALKTMRPEIVENATLRDRFSQEATVSSRIKSKHVVSVLDAGVADGIPFLVMELLEGEELGDVLEAGKVYAPDEAIAILGQVAKGLDKAHAAGIVHRDLKPENLFLARDEDGELVVKILDFGIAKILQGVPKTTVAGGTPLYMSPEQTKKGKITPAADVWALGLIAYRMLVGRPYWEADTMGELYGEILAANYEPASARAGRTGRVLPPGFDAWFARCVTADPDHRFASAGEAVSALAGGGAAGAALVRASSPSIGSGASSITPTGPSLSPTGRSLSPTGPPLSPAGPLTGPGATVLGPPPITLAAGARTTGPILSEPRPVEAKRASSPLPMILAVVLGAGVLGGGAVYLATQKDESPKRDRSARSEVAAHEGAASVATAISAAPAPTEKPVAAVVPDVPTAAVPGGPLVPPGPLPGSPPKVGEVQKPGKAPEPTATAADPAAQRKVLADKVWSGKANDTEIRLLKGLCAQAGDHACRDRAAAMLKKPPPAAPRPIDEGDPYKKPAPPPPEFRDNPYK